MDMKESWIGRAESTRHDFLRQGGKAVSVRLDSHSESFRNIKLGDFVTLTIACFGFSEFSGFAHHFLVPATVFIINRFDAKRGRKFQ